MKRYHPRLMKKKNMYIWEKWRKENTEKSIYHSDRFNSSNIQLNHISTTVNSFGRRKQRIELNRIFLLFSFYTLSPCARDDVMNLMKWFFFGCIYFSKSRQTERHQVSQLNDKITTLIERVQSKQKMPQFCLYFYVFINMDVGRLMNIRIRYTMSSVRYTNRNPYFSITSRSYKLDCWNGKDIHTEREWEREGHSKQLECEKTTTECLELSMTLACFAACHSHWFK